MRVASFVAGGRPRYGVVTDHGLIDLSESGLGGTLRNALTAGLDDIARRAERPVDWRLDEVSWLPPITDPVHIIGVGLNTRSHFAETAELMHREPGGYPAHPRLFMRSPLSHVGHLHDIAVPLESAHLDYEGEIAVVIGRKCRRVSPGSALGFVAGYACYNDGSVRDFQLHSNQVTAGKNFVASGSFGPWLTTSDEAPDVPDLRLQTRVNGEIRQQLVMDDLIFGIPSLISYISRVYELQPGDVILSGSPAGVGAVSGTWLLPGDQVEVEITGVGTLRNSVASEKEGTE